jgi:hypothetical protein
LHLIKGVSEGLLARRNGTDILSTWIESPVPYYSEDVKRAAENCTLGRYIDAVWIYSALMQNSDQLGIFQLVFRCVSILPLNLPAQNITISASTPSNLQTQTVGFLSCSTWVVGVSLLLPRYFGCGDNIGMVGVSLICASKETEREQLTYHVPELFPGLTSSTGKFTF